VQNSETKGLGLDLVYKPACLAILRHLRQKPDSRANIAVENNMDARKLPYHLKTLLRVGLISRLERPQSSLDATKKSRIQPYAITQAGLLALEMHEKTPLGLGA
jgi:hypothetical protein